MTTDEKATHIEVLFKAQKDGKIIEFNSSPTNSMAWIELSENYSRSIVALALDYGVDSLRIKPAEPTLRPWKPEEVPVGALIRNKLSHPRELPATILNVIVNYHNIGDAIITDKLIRPSCPGNYYFISDLVTYHGGNNGDRIEHSLDHGKTWLPCGVME